MIKQQQHMIVSQTIFSTSSASAAHTSAVTRTGLEPSPLDVILKRIVRLPDTRAPICVRIPSYAALRPVATA